MSGGGSFLESKGFKLFMVKLYGLGAAVVIVGAMFKIMHWPGASAMLVIGLTVEAFIFGISAFEPPHEMPNWSLVYPELAGYDPEVEEIELEKKEEEKKIEGGFPAGNFGGMPYQMPYSESTSALDKMLESADIKPDLLRNLGESFESLKENISQMSDISEASVASIDFAGNMRTASEYVEDFKHSLEADIEISNKFKGSFSGLNDSVQSLSDSFNKTANNINNSIDVNEYYVTTIKNVTDSFNNLSVKYQTSADKIDSSFDQMSNINVNSSRIISKLDQISNNLSALNSVYEMQLKQSAMQNEISKELNSAVSVFKDNLNDSSQTTDVFKNQLDDLNQNMAKLNIVYSNMLKAMTSTKNPFSNV